MRPKFGNLKLDSYFLPFSQYTKVAWHEELQFSRDLPVAMPMHTQAKRGQFDAIL
jgi:hypothetical protein